MESNCLEDSSLTGQPGLGALVLKVVDREMGGTTASEFHCSGSWPAWMATVPM